MIPKKKIKKLSLFNSEKPLANGGYTLRYLMELPLGDRMFLSWVNCEIPSVTMTYNMQGEFRYGRGDWQPIQIIFRDLCFGYEEEDWNEFQTRLLNWARSNNKINATIKRINPLGEATDTWHLRGCFPSVYHIIYDDTHMDSTEITLHYDHCRLN